MASQLVGRNLFRSAGLKQRRVTPVRDRSVEARLRRTQRCRPAYRFLGEVWAKQRGTTQAPVRGLDKQMLPIPLEVRRGPWENQKRRARDLESVRR
jgi:hypothetical protein